LELWAGMTGTVLPFAGATAPNGWLLCHGQAVSRTTYASLFAVVGTTYGTGDGSTTFNVPDLRGRAIAGKDDMGGTAANRLTAAGGVTGATLGAVGGGQTHALTQAQLPALTFLTTNNTGSGTPALDFSGPDALGFYSVGGGTAHPNVQPTIVLNSIIKA
jgi:microcystin-dependent protein